LRKTTDENWSLYLSISKITLAATRQSAAAIKRFRWLQETRILISCEPPIDPAAAIGAIVTTNFGSIPLGESTPQ
jgi:hypothetical protein